MSSILRTIERKQKREHERKEMKTMFGKKAKHKCPHCGKYSLFRKVMEKTLKDKEKFKMVCVRCGK